MHATFFWKVKIIESCSVADLSFEIDRTLSVKDINTALKCFKIVTVGP